jgi:hypothetical protein
MSVITSNLTPHSTRARRHASRSLWRDIGVGLVFPLIVLAATALETRGRPSTQPVDVAAQTEAPMPVAFWGDAVPPGLYSTNAR